MHTHSATAPRIRRAVPADSRALAHIQVDSYRTAYAGIFPPSYLDRFTYEAQEQDWRDLLAADTGDVLLVAAQAGGALTGYILARVQPEVYPGYDAEIVAMHVRQPLQRQGTGSALLRRAMDEIEARGCRSVVLWTLKTNPVRAWYERLGGKSIAEKSWQMDGWEIVEVAYGWPTLPLKP